MGGEEVRLENMAENGDVLKDGMDEPFPSLLGGSHEYIIRCKDAGKS